MKQLTPAYGNEFKGTDNDHLRLLVTSQRFLRGTGVKLGSISAKDAVVIGASR